MECNKDEATRAKSIAEKKLADKDYNGAKKFILKAQTLYPGLDGISQMLTTLEVYIAAENKVSGETDWYAILGVKPADDDETIRKNYRKLALMLHPDKNKSVGADGAFKLLSEAWSLLSDKAKRLAYNQRRSMRSFQQKMPSTTPAAPNGVQTFAKQATSRTTSRTTTTTTRVAPGAPAAVRPPPPPPPPAVNQRTDTFWTICHRCKMHYEYLNLYLNHTLLCPNCHEPFQAKEMPPPVNLPKPPQHKPTSTSGFNSYENKNVHWGNTDPSIASKAASVVQQVNDRLKREREEFSKKRKFEDDGQSSTSVKIPFQMSTGILKKTGFETDRGYGYYTNIINNRQNTTRELTPLETRKMLIHKAQKDIRKKLIQLESEEKSKEKKTETKTETENEKENENETEELAMNVPDPDFHDFDLERTENSFEENQVWAAYDDDDGMPRFYALIHKVISRKPLKLQLSWLNSKTTSEFGSLDWLGYGFRKTCGEFRIGRYELNKNLNSFSQKIAWKKSPRGSVLIYPKKGEVWALYRNWSKDWDENVPDEIIHKYDMVEVLEDYDEEKGVTVSKLVKYVGFRTVFHPRNNESEVKLIPKEEMFRFSHQVPKYILNGKEADNSPKDCLELDPAATPLDLINEKK